VHLGPEVRLLPPVRLSGLANPDSEVLRELLRGGGRVDIPLRHPLLPPFESLGDVRVAGGPEAPDPDGSGDLGAELRAIPAYGEDGPLDRDRARTGRLLPAKFANQGNQSVKPK